MSEECPKCDSLHTWHQVMDGVTFLRCMCGLCKPERQKHMAVPLSRQRVEQFTQHIRIIHIEQAESTALPRKDTKLWDCLMMLAGLAPASTQEITDRLNIVRVSRHENGLSVSDVATQLTVLANYKHLAMLDENRKGYAGGSVWVLTESAKRLIGKGVNSRESRNWSARRK